MHVCTLAHGIGHVWRSEVNSTEPVLSLHHHAGPRLSFICLHSESLYPPSHLPSSCVGSGSELSLGLFAFSVRTREEKPLGFRFFQSIMLQLMVGSNILWLGLSGGIPVVQSKASGPPPASAVRYSRGFQVEGTCRVISAERQT